MDILVFLIIYALSIVEGCWHNCSLNTNDCISCLVEQKAHSLNSQTGNLCDLWDSSSCSTGYYSASIIQKEVIINDNLGEKLLNLSFTLPSSFHIYFTEFTIGEKNESKCAIYPSEKNDFQLGVQISSKDTKSKSLIWLIGEFIDSQFRGFIDFKSFYEFPSKFSIDCLEIPSPEDCEQCNNLCPVWMWPNRCQRPFKRFLSSCSFPCATCWNSGTASCITCMEPYYYFDGYCYTACPSGAKAATSYYNSKFCRENYIHNDYFDFYQIEVADEAYTIGSISGGIGPVFWSERGWYFDGTNYYKSTFSYSFFFTISFFVLLEDSHDGSYSDTINYIFSTSTDSSFEWGVYAQWFEQGNFYFKIKENYSPTFWSSNNPVQDHKHWVHYMLAYQKQSDYTGMTIIYKDNSVLVGSVLIPDAGSFHTNFNNNKYIGANPDVGSNGFKGFMYYFHSYNRGSYIGIGAVETTFICSQGHSDVQCNLCPHWTNTCINNCPHDSIFDPTTSQCTKYSCDNCSGGCPNGISFTNQCKPCVVSDDDWTEIYLNCRTCTGRDSCSSCIDSTYSFNFGICIPGYYDLCDDSDTSCSEECWSGSSSPTCSWNVNFNPNGPIFALYLNKIEGIPIDKISGIPVRAGNSDDFYPNYDSNDPKATYLRGYYFDGNAYMELPPYDGTPLTSSNRLIFAQLFTFSVWIWSPETYTKDVQCIFAKVDPNFNTIFAFSFANKSSLMVQYRAKINMNKEYHLEAVCDTSISPSFWYHIGVAIHFDDYITTPVFHINGFSAFRNSDVSSVSTRDWYMNKFVDAHDYFMTIGTYKIGYSQFADSSKWLTGYIYSIKIWNDAIDPAINEIQNNCGGWCSQIGGITMNICPSNWDGSATAGQCLHSTAIDSYDTYDDLAWISTACDSNCSSKGCRVNTDKNCNLCGSPLCAVCNDYANTANACQSCVSGAQRDSNGLCYCPSPLVFDSDLQTCTKSSWSYDCYHCSSFSMGSSCPNCMLSSCINAQIDLNDSSNSILLCPLGYKLSGASCVAVKKDQLVVHYIFNKQTETIADLISGYRAYIGTNTNSIAFPISVYQSGLYFNGNVYASLPPNNADSRSLILGNVYSILIWARPQSNTSSYLLSKENASSLRMLFGITSALLPTSIHKLYTNCGSDSSFQTTTFSGSSPSLNSWIYYELFVQKQSSRVLTVSLSYNLKPIATSTYNEVLLKEAASDVFIIGKSSSKNSFFIGFIYEIEILNFKADALLPSTLSTNCGCDACANLSGSGSDCLTSCNYNEFYNSGSCTSCASKCNFGCMRNSDCIKNEDNLCLSYTGFNKAECTTCIDGAAGSGNGCECIAHFHFDSASNSCVCNNNLVFDSTTGACSCTPNWVIDPSTGDSCICATNSVLNTITNQCDCPTYSSFDKGMDLCKCMNHSILDEHNNICNCIQGFHLVNSQCICIDRSIYDQSNDLCRCATQSIYNSEANTCDCVINSIYDSKTNSCKCIAQSAYNSNTNSCDCASNSSLDQSNNICKCIELSIYKSSTNSCDCIANSSFDQASSSCKCVSQSIYNTATEACDCAINSSFDQETNSCKCIDHSTYNAGTNSCNCDYSFELNGGVCAASNCTYHIQNNEVAAYFSTDYTSLIFDMKYPLLSSMPKTCTGLFKGSDLAKFGSSPSCSWTSDMMSLTVVLGDRATVLNDDVNFLSGVLYSSKIICGYTSAIVVTAKITYKYPKPPISPQVTLTAPSQILYGCDGLDISTSEPNGGYNRPLSYSWAFSSSPTVAALSSSASYSSSITKISISKANLGVTKAIISLTVINWLGNSATVTKTVNILDGKDLAVTIDGDAQLQLKTSQSSSISLSTSSKCPGSHSYEYSWRLVNKSGAHAYVNESHLWSSQKNSTILYCQGALFKPGVYTFEANVIDTLNPLLSGNIQFDINYSPSDLIVTFSESTMTSIYLEDLKVDANVLDPDNLTEPVNYLWSCKKNGSDCSKIIVNQTDSVLNVKGENIALDAPYVFSITVTKNSRSATSSVQVNVLDRTGPPMNHSPIPNYVNCGEDFVLWVYPSNSNAYTYAWNIIQGENYTILGYMDSNSIGFKANSLDFGETYILELSVSNQTGGNWKYWYSLKTGGAPTGGSFSVSPSSGIEYSTVFYLSAPRWQHPSGEQLNYQFGYISDNDEIPLSIRSSSSYLYTTLPYDSSNLQLYVKVIGEDSGYTILTKNITISQNSSLATTDVITDLQNKLNQKTIDIPSLVTSMNSVTNKVIKNSNATIDEVKTARSLSLIGINQIIDLVTVIDYNHLQTVTKILEKTTLRVDQLVDEDSSSNALDIASKLLEKVKANNITLGTEMRSLFMNVIGQCSNINETTATSDPSLLHQTTQNLLNLYKTASSSMTIGQTSTSDSQYMHTVVQVLNSNSIAGYQSPKNSSYIGSYSIPSNVNLEISSDIIGIMYAFIIYDNPDNSSSSSDSRGIDFSAIGVTEEGNTTLQLDFSPNYANISIPLYSQVSSDEVQCSYYTNGIWSTEGCKLVSFEYPTALCQCSHASLYSALNVVSNDDKDTVASWYGVFYYSLSLWIFYIITSIAFAYLDNKEWKSLFVTTNILSEGKDSISPAPSPVEYKVRKAYPSLQISESGDNLFESQEESKFEDTTFKISENISSVEKIDSEPNDRKEEKAFDNSVISVDPLKMKEPSLKIKALRHHYFISCFFFYIPYYRRTARFSLMIFSLSLQALLYGIFADFYGSGVSDTKDYDLDDIGPQIVFAFAMPVATNLLASLVGWKLFRNEIKVTLGFITKNDSKSSFFGYTICMIIIFTNVWASYLIADDMDGNSSKVWIIMVYTGVGFDFFVVQIVKVLFRLLVFKGIAIK